jgi:long-chain-fatty-acid--[acyl-carrier-protein] ligase
MAEIKAAIQMEFPATSNPPIPTLKTIGDFCTMAVGKSPVTETLKPCHFREVSVESILLDIDPENDSIPACIEKICRNDPKSLFLYDGNLGEMTRGDFLLKSYVIGEYLKKYTSTRIGIMLPALGATSLLLTGSYIAGKVPVMLNWTVGEKSFAHCMNFANLETILTSRRFYEKISSPWLSSFEGKMVFIEDILKDISPKTKLFALINMKI